jgi:hypothetical protein
MKNQIAIVAILGLLTLGLWQFANARINNPIQMTPAYEDLRFPVGNLSPGATAPDPCNVEGNIRVSCFDGVATSEMVDGAAQMPHAWKEGSVLYPHIHWGPSSAAAGNVKWILDYDCANINGTYNTITTVSSTQAAGGTAHKQNIVALPTIDMTGKTISATCLFHLYRNPADTADTYGADAELYEFDIHYEIDALGSRAETAK